MYYVLKVKVPILSHKYAVREVDGYSTTYLQLTNSVITSVISVDIPK